jgi:hypothetical protein
MVWKTLLTTGAISCALVANSAELSPKGTKNDGVIISLSGEIKERDGAKLEASLENAKNLGLHVSALVLDSPGGLISVGASMAKLVRSNQLKTIVNDGAICASACFMVFAAGKERFSGENAKIGVHSAVNPEFGENDNAKSATIDMTRFLSELGVPSLILGKLVTTRPSEIAWLTPEDLQSMRINIVRPPTPRESYVERVAPTIEKIPAKTLKEDLRKASTLMAQGLSQIRAGQPNQAIPLLKLAAGYSSYDPDIASTYGYALHLSGHNEDAKGAIMLALQIKPDFSETYRVLALTVASLNDQTLARDSLLSYYKYSNYKDIALEAIRGMTANKSASNTLKAAAKDALSIVVAR